jgi:parvulin-like peptidyl-prolyl isomerase
MISFALAAIVALQVPQKHLAPPPKPEQVLATVNGKPITAGQVAPLLWQWRGEEALQDLISYQTVVSEAHRVGVSVTDAQVEKALDEQLVMLKKDPQVGDLDQWMRDNGFTRSRLFLRKKAELLLDELVAKGFNAQNYVKVSTIMIKPANEQATSLASAITKAQAAYDRLKAGESWDKVLPAYVTDANVIKSKGLLGWRSLDAFPDSVRRELGTLPIGSVTQPAQTQFGIQLFRVEARGGSATEQQLTELKAFYNQTARNDYLQKLRSSTKVERMWPSGSEG